MLANTNLRKILSSVLLGALMLTTAINTAYAAPDDELDPDIYDVESYESGLYDWETSIQLAQEFEPNVLLVKFHPRSMFPGKEKQYQDAVEQVTKWGFEYIEAIDTYVVYVEDMAKNPNAALNRFKNNRFIELVEPNYLGTLDAVPNDTDYPKVSGYAKNINAEAGWDIITYSSVPVAVIDSGYGGNNDLPPARGYSVLTKTTDTPDTGGHGTMVAGTLGAIGGNRMGTVGVVWDAKIIPVKVTSSSTITVANVATAITWAADNGARIINMSLGTTSNSATLKSAVDYAYKKGCILVAATGNSGAAAVEYPAAYPNVIGVGGTSNGTTRNNASCYGSGLDVLANIIWYTTTPANSYMIISGTSFASPQVAGLAALVWELAPGLTNGQVIDLIHSNTNRADGKWDLQTGYGIIDMGKTLAAAKALGGGTTPPGEPKDTVKPVITLKGAATINLTQGDTYVEPGYTAIDDRDGDITHLVTVSGTVATAYAGEYALTYTVYDKAGNVGTAIRKIIVKATPAPDKKPPVITQIGSNPIILHLGGSPYAEQGAIAFDEVDGDLSAFIEVSGNVDTSKARTYNVTYKVTNSLGLSSSITREVRVLEPKVTISRTPYSFSGQGKAGAKFNYNVKADDGGLLTLTVGGLNKTTIQVRAVDSTGVEVFKAPFPGNATKEFWVAAGSCFVEVSILEGNGNVKFDLSMLMPELRTEEFLEAEVPLANLFGGNAENNYLLFSLIGNVVLLVATGVFIVLFVRKRKAVL